MLGGAAGATIGRLSGSFICHSVIGFIAGWACSVLLNLVLMSVTEAMKLLTEGKELEGRPIGGATSEKLAGLMGGISGATGAVVVATLPTDVSLLDTRVSVVCWTVTAFIPIILILGLVHYTRWKNRAG